MTADLTPEALALLERFASNTPRWRDEMRAIEAAAIARYREGLVDQVARGIQRDFFGTVRTWDQMPEKSQQTLMAQARRFLGEDG